MVAYKFSHALFIVKRFVGGPTAADVLQKVIKNRDVERIPFVDEPVFRWPKSDKCKPAIARHILLILATKYCAIRHKPFVGGSTALAAYASPRSTSSLL